jgi:hypothetical protein
MSVLPAARTDMKTRCEFIVTPTWLVTPPPPQANADALRNEANTNAPAIAILYF